MKGVRTHASALPGCDGVDPPSVLHCAGCGCELSPSALHLISSRMESECSISLESLSILDVLQGTHLP